MKIGIFADIHGNSYAFNKVWQALKEEACDLHCFLGDICGYYYHQNEVIDMLKAIGKLICVKGNHDQMFLTMIDDSKLEREYSSRYGKSGSLLKETITKENLQFLKNLPDHYVIEDYKIGIFHGSPWDYLNEYIYPTNSLERFKDLEYRAVFLGHTHYPMHQRLKNTQLINPGSCGQPRDMNLASYAIFDLDQGKVSFKRVNYDRQSLIGDIEKNKESNKYLIEVLKRESKLHV